MINRNFTDEEIRKALECCASYDCDACPLYSPTINCVIVLPEKALELVDRQRAGRSKAIKEFAENVKAIFECDLCFADDVKSYILNEIDSIVKEMTEGNNESQNT